MSEAQGLRLEWIEADTWREAEAWGASASTLRPWPLVPQLKAERIGAMGEQQRMAEQTIRDVSTRQQERESLRRQVGIWLSRTIPPHPSDAAGGLLEASGAESRWWDES